MRSDINIVLAALAIGRVAAQSTIVPAYAQCGGVSWTHGFECEPGFSCVPASSSATADYICQPTGGPNKVFALNYAQCGGQNFVGLKVCTTGWHCEVQNVFFSTCQKDATFVIPPRPVAYPWPQYNAPGDKCGDDKVAVPHGPCTPGFSCKFSGLWTWWTCQADAKPISSATTTKAATTTAYYPPTTTLKTTTKVVVTTPVKPTTKVVVTTSVKPTTKVMTTTTAKTTAKSTTPTMEYPPTTTKGSTTAVPTSGGQPLWAQCGGIGYTGPLYCQAPIVCVYSNVWFSQCLAQAP